MPRVVAEHSSNISESPKPTAVTSLVEREDSKSTASGTSLVQSTETLVECRQENLSAPSTGLLRHSSEALSLVTRSEPRRSLQSVVSFREEVKEIDNETTTTVKLTPLAHLVEMAPTLAQKRKLATILKVPGYAGRPPFVLGRLWSFAVRRHQRSVGRAPASRPAAPRDEQPKCVHRRGVLDAKRRQPQAFLVRARLDVHDAFLMGPSLISVMGGICSFHTSGNRRALTIIALASEGTEQPMTGVKWAIVTLPGVVLALVICSTAIWLLYIRPHEPAPQSVENLAVIRAAQQKHTGRRTHMGIRYACAAYAAIFSFVYALSVVVGLTERMALLTAMIHIWQMMPWGVLLLLGATHVASELLRAYDFLQKALASTSFWEQRTPLEAQTVLAFATSVMAEAADKRVLVEIMTPAVTRIAEAQRVYPAYYAIPMIVGASSNFIMPASMPLALLHEMARVQFWRLFMLGLFAKIVVVAMVIVTVNAADRAGLLAAQTPPE
ncbi:hypothetical protein MRX96_018476 [Rhipicephalus microplus]